MTALFITLSSGGGEALFIGALTGLTMWGLTSIGIKIRNHRQQKRDEKSLILFNQKITSKGGLLVLFEELFTYLKTRFSIEEFVDDGNVVESLRQVLYSDECIDKGNIIVGNTEAFLIVVLVKGNTYNTLKVVIVNNGRKKRKEWDFQFDDSQSQMIEAIETYLKAKRIIF